MPAVQHDGHIDVGDVALPQRPLARHAMADHVIGRDAEGVAIAAVVEAGRQGAVIEDELARQAVELAGDDARFDVRGQHVEALGRQRPAARMPANPSGPCNGIGSRSPPRAASLSSTRVT